MGSSKLLAMDRLPLVSVKARPSVRSTRAPRTPTPASMLIAKNRMMRTRMPPISPTRRMFASKSSLGHHHTHITRSLRPLGLQHHARQRQTDSDERAEEDQVAQVHHALAEALEAAEEAEGGDRVDDRRG